MTAFVKELFNIHRGYITYGSDYNTAKFIARFKYQGGACRPYVTFLIKHFTVEEFFAIADAHEKAQCDGSVYKPGYEGGTWKAAEERGFIMPHIKKWLRERGYEVSRAGYKQMLADEVAASLKRIDDAKLAA